MRPSQGLMPRPTRRWWRLTRLRLLTLVSVLALLLAVGFLLARPTLRQWAFARAVSLRLDGVRLTPEGRVLATVTLRYEPAEAGWPLRWLCPEEVRCNEWFFEEFPTLKGIPACHQAAE